MQGGHSMDKAEVERLYRAYCDTIYRICFLYMKNEADALDMVQETYMKLIRSNFSSQSEEKTKAWLIVTGFLENVEYRLIGMEEDVMQVDAPWDFTGIILSNKKGSTVGYEFVKE